MSTGPQLIRAADPRERNWLPLIIATGVVLVIAVVAVLAVEHGRSKPTVTPINAAADPYAANLAPLRISSLASRPTLPAAKLLTVDGHIANKGAETVTAVTVQVLFRDAAHEVAQNETSRSNLSALASRRSRSAAGLRCAAQAPATSATSG